MDRLVFATNSLKQRSDKTKRVEMVLQDKESVACPGRTSLTVKARTVLPMALQFWYLFTWPSKASKKYCSSAELNTTMTCIRVWQQIPKLGVNNSSTTMRLLSGFGQVDGGKRSKELKSFLVSLLPSFQLDIRETSFAFGQFYAVRAYTCTYWLADSETMKRNLKTYLIVLRHCSMNRRV